VGGRVPVCTLKVFLDKEQALPDGWWQISVTEQS